jgi:MSHA biogenesis protein MshM
LFTGAALRGLYRASGGTPRLVNILAHKALMAAFGEGKKIARLRHVQMARSDTEGARAVGWWLSLAGHWT